MAAAVLFVWSCATGFLIADERDMEAEDPEAWATLLEEEAALMAELEELMSPWFSEIVIHTGVGFQENILRGSGIERDGWAHLMGGEGFWSYKSAQQRQWILFASAEAVRFPEVDDAQDEILAFAMTRWEQPLFGDLRGSLGATFSYSQQPFDLASDELEVVPETVRVRTLRSEAGLSHPLGDLLELAWRGGAVRTFHQFSVDDYTEAYSRIGVEANPSGSTWSLALGIEGGMRWFDSRSSRDTDGRLTPGRTLRYERAHLYLEGRWRPDADRRWTSRLRTTTGIRHDNGDGDFDYRRRQVSFSQEFRAEHGTLRASIGLSDFKYDHQTVAPADDRAHQWRDWDARLEWDWRVHPRGTLRWTGSWERLTSRREHEAFRSRFAGLTFRWEI